MPENKMTHDELQARLLVAPFHKWLGLELLELRDEGIVVGAKRREEFVVNPKGQYTHGGILATLIDVVSDFALAAKLGRPYPTVDLRVDYHRAAMPGDLKIVANVIKLGSSISTAEASVFDGDDKLLASGRGVYFTAQ